jgi:hypothetical protein
MSLSIRGDADFTKGVAITLAPGHAPDVQAGFLGGIAVRPAEIQIGLKITPPPDQPERRLIGAPDASRLAIKTASFFVGARLVSVDTLDAFVGIELEDARVVIKPAPDEADAFLASLLGQDGISASLSFGVRLSSVTGFHLTGASGLEGNFPVHINFGPISVQSLSLGLKPNEQGIEFAAGATVTSSLGPLAIAIEGVGFKLTAQFPDSPTGNLGPIDVGFGFLPPKGLGIVIDAQAVVGGGYLHFDPQRAEYSGTLELQIAERIAVKAIGVLTTRLPDGTNGAEGYSLLILITAEGFTPIPLGLGFTLTGIGGLLAINRTFAEEALRAGLKNHTLDSVMFPQDPLRNIPQIISNLNSVFPPANGHHLFGPMVQIAWGGTPPLITAELGLVLEFGARRRLLVLGQVAAILPRPDHELLRLQMDAIGVLDFDQGTAALDATLYDSRLLKRFPLTGDMAMRLQWERSRNFALAVGGLHPAFHPPSNFPKLARLALDLSRGDNPRLRCEAYFALTSNTVQFGARAELYASAIGFSIHGEIGIDVLIQRAPFHFLADFYAQVQLKRGSTNLFKVRVEGTLEGPLPLHIKGKATFEILWWDVTVRFNATLVGGVTPLLAELIDVLPLLREALVHPSNWRSQLPAGQRPMVTLRATPGAATDVCLHPLGTLTVTQSVVPLNLEISRFGAAMPVGARSFTISSVSLGSLGGQHQTPPSVTDFFARAQFFEMSDDEKLSSPSFEPMVAGFRIASDAFVFSENPDDWLDVDKIAYDTITVDTETNELRRSLRRSEPNALYVLSPVLLGKQARFGAAGSSDLRRTGSAKYRTTRGGTYELLPEEWIIVPTEALPARPAPGSASGTLVTYSEAVQALRQLQQEDPAKAAGLTILRLSELPLSEVPRG